MGSIAYLKYKARTMASWLESFLNVRNKEIFDYEFSGISVWVEPDEAHATQLTRTMARLAEQCGGPVNGLHEFAPHCTMLYNIPAQSFGPRSSLAPTATLEQQLKNASQEMLDRCLSKYEYRMGGGKSIMLNPISLQCFRFPPYSCFISFLHLEHTRELEQLHDIVKGLFPPDERHQGSGRLMAHMSLVYAPEAQGNFLMQETAKLASQNGGTFLLEPMRAKYLSVWSTEGKTSDWKCLARVELP